MSVITTEEFIRRSISIHGDRYDYSQTEYSGNNNHVTIICKTHGAYRQRARAHLDNQNCPKCSQRANWKPATGSGLKYFIEKAKSVHGETYSYDKVVYNGIKSKVVITCPVHGDFTQRAERHLNGSRCPNCCNNKKKTTEQFITEAIQIHGNYYDYSQSIYENANSKLIIICPKHGQFKQKPAQHTNGQGCKQCGLDRSISAISHDTNSFIEKSKSVHGDTYDYSSVDYKHRHGQVTIICREHGPFYQRASDHMNNQNGCPLCAGNKLKTTEEFVREASARWNNRYSYDKTIYVNGKDKLIVTCKKHGDFNIGGQYHLDDGGCPSCSLSTEQHDMVEFIKSLYTGNVIINDRKTIKPLEIDILIPELNIGIELNGLYYHSYRESETTDQRLRHAVKHNMCREAKIKLLQFTDHEWNKKRDIVKSMIKNALGLSNRIGARKCKLTTTIPTEFFKTNHIAGFKAANISYGLELNGQLICAMSFTNHGNGKWEICRLASLIGMSVTGGPSKLLKHFITQNNPKTIFTYADARFSNGNAYRQIGFKNIKKTRPNYFYIGSKCQPMSRIGFQKHKLKSILQSFDETLSESQNMFNNGYRRTWDAGHYKLEMTVTTFE